MLNDQQKFDLDLYLKDAGEKLAALPERLKAERESSLTDPGGRRRPFPIIPLTEVDPDSMREVIAALDSGKVKVPAELQEIVGNIRRTVTIHPTARFAMRCDQLVGVLALAGIKASPDANVQG